jgi:RNA polymerase sigma factor (sigma-70 family)
MAHPAQAHNATVSSEEELVARAVGGDKVALEEVVHLLQDPLYRLALRMVWRPADAEDATQEILIRTITRLATWRAEAKLLTWAYRIGVNYLLNLRRRTPQEQVGLSLEEFREDLADGLATRDYNGPEAQLLAELPMRQASRQGHRDRTDQSQTTCAGHSPRQRPHSRRSGGADAQAARCGGRVACPPGLRGSASQDGRGAGAVAVREVPAA